MSSSPRRCSNRTDTLRRLVTVAECVGLGPYQVVGTPSKRDATWTCSGSSFASRFGCEADISLLDRSSRSWRSLIPSSSFFGCIAIRSLSVFLLGNYLPQRTSLRFHWERGQDILLVVSARSAFSLASPSRSLRDPSSRLL